MNHAGREHSGQQTTTQFYHAAESNFLFFFISDFKIARPRHKAGLRLKGTINGSTASWPTSRTGNGTARLESDQHDFGAEASAVERRAIRRRHSPEAKVQTGSARPKRRLFRGGRKFELFQLQGEFGFLLRFFAGGDGFAQTTGMFAVKRVGHGLGERTRAQVVRQHRRPCDGLQHGPMRAGGRDQRHNHTTFSKPREHNGKLYRLCQITSANNTL